MASKLNKPQEQKGSVYDNKAIIERAAEVIRVIDNDVARPIFDLIEKKGEIKVKDIYATLDIEQSVASTHLAKMRSIGIVKTRRESKCIYYSVSSNFSKVLAVVKKLAEFKKEGPVESENKKRR